MCHHAHLKYLAFIFKLNGIEFVIAMVVEARSHGSHAVLELDMKPRMALNPDPPASTFQLQGLQASTPFICLAVPPSLSALPETSTPIWPHSSVLPVCVPPGWGLLLLALSSLLPL